MPLILSENEGNLGIITLNDPKRCNCLGSPLVEELLGVLDRFEALGVWVVILRAAAGSKVWCAGHDIRELSRPGRDPLPYAGPFEHLLHRIQDYPGPVIAMVEGTVWGGGCDLTLCCDIVIGSDEVTFAMTPAKIGLPYNPSGMIHFINILGLKKAREMFYTAEPISASDAHNSGLLNHMVPVTELESFTRDIAAKILKNAPLAIRALKEQFRLLSKGHPIDAETFEKIQAIRRRVYDSADYGEGVQAFLEKRRPCFCGR
jgi:methylmalonyl-CoA decarboxylase